MTEIGLASDSGTDGIEFSTSTDDRRIGFGEEKYVEIAYPPTSSRADLSSFDVVADTELLHRFGDCKLMNPRSTPPQRRRWRLGVGRRGRSTSTTTRQHNLP